MPIAHRRPGLLHLVLPHPALDQTSAPSPSSTAASPHTPRRAPRLLPDGSLPHPRTSIASDRPRSSIDSWNSVDTNEIAWEWKDEELELLSRTLDNIPSHLMTPYVGVIPPPNVLDKLARNITSSRTALEWPHSVRATRVKLHELCRRKTVQKAIERHAPTAQLAARTTAAVVVEPAPARRPLYRQSSMDFLPVKNEPTSVTRLSSRLQRTDRMVPHASFHPYARPSGSRTPTPPPSVEQLGRPRTRSTTPSEASPLRAPSPRKLFRSSATPPPQSLKRAPSFSAATLKTRAQHSRSSVPPESSYSSDEEEKARQATAKRPRTTARRVPSFLGAPLPPLAPSPEEEILDPLVSVPEDPVFAPTIPVSKRKSLPPPPRRSSTKPTASNSVATSVPTTPTPATNAAPRTLRRIGTRNFPPPGATPARGAPLASPVTVGAPQQARRSSSSRPAVAQPRKSSTSGTSANASAVSNASDEERRRERRARREREKEMQPKSEGSRQLKKKSASSSVREAKPSVAPMRF